MYLRSIRRLEHFKELGDEVINTYLKQICKLRSGIKSCTIPSLYAQSFMENEFNYISDLRTIEQLSQLNLLGAILVFHPIARHNHWLLATANMQTKQIYHEDPINGSHNDAGKDGGTVLLQLLSDITNSTGTQFDVKE